MSKEQTTASNADSYHCDCGYVYDAEVSTENCVICTPPEHKRLVWNSQTTETIKQLEAEIEKIQRQIKIRREVN